MDQLYSLNQIFTKRFFRIPDYQRGYAWRVQKEVKEFWEDIINLDESRNHYTGQITIEKIPSNITDNWVAEQYLIGDDYSPMYVIDGQQRLTTSVILVQCICDFLNTINHDKNDDDINFSKTTLARIKAQYIKQTFQKVVSVFLFGYEEDNPSFTFLKSNIFHDKTGAKEEETYYTLNLNNAQKFFRQNLKDVYEAKGITEVERIYTILTKKMLFNLFEIDKRVCDFDVFAAFESMNNRGKKLSNLELLKNRLIYLTTLFTNEELDQNAKITLRETINNAWKVVYAQLGRNKNHPLDDDDFLYAHWILNFPYSRKQGGEYVKFLLEDYFSTKKIQKNVADVNGMEGAQVLRDTEIEDDDDDVETRVIINSALQPKDIENYVISLKEASVKWYETWFPNDQSTGLSPEERLWIDRLNRIGISYFRPLVTASLVLGSAVSSEKRVELFTAIERFIFLVFRTQSAQSNYKSSEFYSSARHLLKREQSVDDIIKRLNECMGYTFSTVEGVKFFNSDYLYNAIKRKFDSGTGYYKWGVLRYFLYEYDYYLWDGNAKRRNLMKWESSENLRSGQISIEHILPQTPTDEYWKTQYKNVPDETMKYLQGTLGNLMLLDQSINSSLQNDSFPDKKEVKKDPITGDILRHGYKNGSYSEIEVSQNEDWTPEEIKSRGLKLLKFMEDRWKIRFESEDKKLKLLFLDMV